MKLLPIILVVSVVACSQAPSGGPAFDSTAEQELVRLVNLERARAGLSSLREDPKLRQAAREHSTKMAAARNLTHQLHGEPAFSARLAQAGVTFNMSAENIAFNQTAESAHQGLMNSPGHRKNILTPDFNAVGIGVVRVGENIWVTQDFAREFTQQSAQEARNQVIAAFLRARREAKMPPVSVVDEARLQSHACLMAKTGDLDSKSVFGLSDVRSVASYTTADLSELPTTAMSLAKNPAIRKIAVGACFGRSAKYEAGMNWVVIGAY